jgi:hypothetical protein
MLEEKDYDSIGKQYIGTEYGDLRRERAALMQRQIFSNDNTVKPRIYKITLEMLELMRKQ